MARRKGKAGRNIAMYEHPHKERVNIPPVGLVTPETDRDLGEKSYAHDPHLDSQLSWSGKAEHTSFEVPTVSLHVHERIDPRTIIEAVRKTRDTAVQGSLFATPEENPPLRQAIEFYRHRHNWTNRLISGDSLLIMNSLIEKEGLGGQVQMVYMDPPYGIRYGSNFQPFVNRREVTDGRDADLTAESEQIRVFRDTWELGIHSYLSYLRDRLLLARELLHETGSCFVQIGKENVHQPGDLVFDPTCGSGATAYVAEQWGRRWITCDTSRVATALAKQRLMTANFDYHELARPAEGVGGGFRYRSVPRVSPKTLAYDEPPAEVVLYDKPKPDRSKTSVTGPFTVEAVPAPTVLPISEFVVREPRPSDDSVARTGPTVRQGDWRDELLKTGIRGKGGQRVAFVRLEPLPGHRHLHAEGETRPGEASAPGARDAGPGARAVVSFGPDHAPMEQRQVARAIEEASHLVPRPSVIVFAAFQFDPEASKDIDETSWPGVTLLKAQMNADLLTDDLKRKRASNESFWLVGQPDVSVERISQGKYKGKFRVSVQGFDYYNTTTGSVESGNADRIALRMLDPDCDGRSLFPRQVFFPMAGAKDGWAKLAKSLRAEIDATRMAAYRGTASLPFESGGHGRAVVKIVDDRGVESLKIVELA